MDVALPVANLYPFSVDVGPTPECSPIFLRRFGTSMHPFSNSRIRSAASEMEGGTTAGGMGVGGEMMATTAGGGGGLYDYSTKPIQISRAH